MNSNFYHPTSYAFHVAPPVKVNDKGNLFKVQIYHPDSSGQRTTPFEVWTTHEAVQKHFKDIGMEGLPEVYQMQKFARHVYDEQLRKSGGAPTQKGIFVSTTQQTHGDPHLWPHTLNDTEIKY